MKWWLPLVIGSIQVAIGVVYIVLMERDRRRLKATCARAKELHAQANDRHERAVAVYEEARAWYRRVTGEDVNVVDDDVREAFQTDLRPVDRAH